MGNLSKDSGLKSEKMEMTDWASQAAKTYFEKNRHATMLRCIDDLATAMRKAKADGMREAEMVIQSKADSYLEIGTFIQADILASYACELGSRARQIEDGGA